MVVPKEQPDEEDGASDDIEALFSDSSNGDVVVPATRTSRWRCSPPLRPRTVRRARTSSWLQSGELSRLCSWCAPAVRKVACVAEAARTAARAEELAEEAATAQEEMARHRRRGEARP
jgi:hypothetical protein